MQAALDYLFDPVDWLPDWVRAQNHYQPVPVIHAPPIIAKDQKDIPDYLKVNHQWEPAVDVNKLTKHQLKVKMCCKKCEEKVVEEIGEVYGVFGVRAEYLENKVVVVEAPSGFDQREVLLKAKKIHRKAKFVDLDPKEKPKPDNTKKDGGDKNKPDNEGNKPKEGNKQQQANTSKSKSNVEQLEQVIWPLWPAAWHSPRYLYPPHQIMHYPNPHGQFVQFI